MANNKMYQNYVNAPIDSYNYYKKSPQAMQNMVENMNFQGTNESFAEFYNATAQKLGQQPTPPAVKTKKSLLTNGSFLKGIAIGAGIAFVATNPTLQKMVVGGAVKLWSNIQNGVEEMKEQMHDAKAEMAEENANIEKPQGE